MHMTNTRTLRTIQRQGFTLMEMLVVVAIIVMLAGLGGYYYIKQLDNAKVSTARSQMKSIEDACKTYYLHHDNYPPNLEALLVVTDDKGPYLETADAIKDPWGKPYQYNPQGPNNAGRKPDIWCEAKGQQVGNWSAMK